MARSTISALKKCCMRCAEIRIQGRLETLRRGASRMSCCYLVSAAAAAAAAKSAVCVCVCAISLQLSISTETVGR